MFYKRFIRLILPILIALAVGCGKQKSSTPSTVENDSVVVKGKFFTVTKHFDVTSETWYYLTRIDHKDPSGKIVDLRMALTDSSKLLGETASDFAARMNAILVFNASMSTFMNTSSGQKRIPVGIQIINGKIVQNISTKRYTVGIKSNDTLKAYSPGTTPQEMITDGADYAFTAFIPLIQNHEPVAESILDEVGNSSEVDPRQVIAQFDNLDIMFLTCGGRGHGGKGMTAKDIIRILKALNVKFAFNLDGGGSISLVANGEFINPKIDSGGTAERLRGNFLYVK